MNGQELTGGRKPSHFLRKLALGVLMSGFAIVAAEAAAPSWRQAPSQQVRQSAPVIAKPEPLPPVSKPVAVTVPAVYAPGSLVIVNNERKLYYITGKGEALRYGVAVGTQSQLWMGRTFVAAKAVDPKWIPVNGDEPVEGGDPKNPLGKRALYLDWSLLRIHGTPSRRSIGSATSNGCIRMLNEDVIDLFERVHLGAPVYAIESWAKATRFEANRVAEKIYVDPEAHKEAQEDLKEQLAELARQKLEQEREERRMATSNQRRQSYPAAWQPTRSALGGVYNWR
jgi:lipoprotein-anchoring transpeptidase ErfK/SrfK